MKTAQFSDAQVMGILKQAEGGLTMSDNLYRAKVGGGSSMPLGFISLGMNLSIAGIRILMLEYWFAE